MWWELAQSAPLPLDWTNLGLAGAIAAAFAAGWIVAKPSVDSMKRQYEAQLADKDKQIERLVKERDDAREAFMAAMERTHTIDSRLRAIEESLKGWRQA